MSAAEKIEIPQKTLPDQWHEFSVLRTRFRASQETVRVSLRQVLAALGELDVSESLRASLELVLAEVLNNICEHAYKEQDGGMIEVAIRRAPNELFCHTIDEGEQLPGDAVPQGSQPELDGPMTELPEGGFGWYLIHTLTKEMKYARIGKRNHFSFWMDLEASE